MLQRIFLCFFFLAVTATAFAQTENFLKIKIFTDDAGLKRISALGIPVDHGTRKEGIFFISDFSESEVQKIKQAGFQYEVLQKDVARYYRQRNSHQSTALSGSASCYSAPDDYATPAGFQLGSMGGFFTYAEMLEHLDTMAARYPNLITVRQPVNDSLTHEGRPVYWIKISDNPNTDEAEPEVLYTALHHAREPASLSTLIFYMYYLLENYAANPEIKSLVDNTEMYFIPCINPDGYIYNQTTDPSGGGMWRKNRRNNGDGTFGVDLNRNYGHEWGYDDNGSSPYTNSQVYRGPSAFSEPETQMMREFCTGRNFNVALNYHTYGDLLIYPWGYVASLLTPDSSQFETYARLLTHDNHYTHGTGDQTVGYVVNGDSDDWMYGEQSAKNKIFALTPEAGDAADGFWPASSKIIPICKENMLMNLTAARLAGSYATVEDATDNVLVQTNGHFYFDITQIGMTDTAGFTVSITPLDTLIDSVEAAKVFNSLLFMQPQKDSIEFFLNPEIQPGQELRYVLTISGAGFTIQDTLLKFFGESNPALTDEGNNLNNWSSSGWGTTATEYYSPSSSITDSPSGFYSDNAAAAISLAKPVNLINAQKAFLEFYAKWDIEADYDYVQIEASVDNSTWQPLCGKYTKPGSSFQDQGQPLYDGLQREWVKEEINLQEYLGEELYLRFRLVSDNYVTKDGFYFDDLKITAVQQITASFTVSDSAPCIGDSVFFVNTSAMADSFEWRINGSLADTTENFKTVFDSAGTYTVTLTAYGDASSDTAEITIEVGEGIVEAGFAFIKDSLTVQFFDQSVNGKALLWEFGDGDTSSAANPVHVFGSLTQFQVCLTASNACSADQSCETINFAPSAVDEPSRGEVKIYPNPANDILTVMARKSVFTLYDLLGKEVKRAALTGEKTVIDISGLPAGLYLYKISGGTEQRGKVAVH